MRKHRISVLDVYSPAVRAAIQRAAPEEFELRFAESYDPGEQKALAADADFILVGWASLSADMVGAAPRLRMVQKWGIGVDRIDVTALRAANIPLAITAGANAGPVAEHAIMLMLAVLRRVTQVDPALRRGIWLKAEMRSVCLQLTGKTVGLIGFGNIGRKVAEKLRGFDVTLFYYDVRRLDLSAEAALGAWYRTLDELLAESDIVSLHAPLTAESRHLINDVTLARMKPQAVLINTARGELVDEAALYRALTEGRLFGAGLDAFGREPPSADNPLLRLDNVVVTPHTGGAVYDNVEHTARHAFGNILRFMHGEPLSPADIIVAPSAGS